MHWRHTWFLAMLALAGAAWYAWRDEMTAQAIHLGVSLLALAALTAVIFVVWASVRGRREGLRDCWMLVLGAFVFFAAYPWILEAFIKVDWIRELLRRSATFGFVSDLVWYLVPIALALGVMWIGSRRGWLNDYFLRFEMHLVDLGILVGLGVVTLAGMLLWFKFGATGAESWHAFGAGKSAALLIAAGIVSSIGNALAEEFWFRGFFLGTFKRITDALAQERLGEFADSVRDWLRERLLAWTVTFLVLSGALWALAYFRVRIFLTPAAMHQTSVWLFALAWLPAGVHFLRSPAVAALVLQAVLFGFIHFRTGIPHGWAGLILAGAWGYVLGYWTLKRMSLWPATILHAMTDLFIFLSVNRIG